MSVSENYDHFHEITILNEVTIISKNFNYPLNTDKTINATNFDLSITDFIYTEGKKNFINKTIDVVILGNEIKNILANISVLFSFDIKSSSKYIHKHLNTFTIDAEINSWLDDIVLATTRGIMYSEFRGTFLTNAILPIIKSSILKHKEP